MYRQIFITDKRDQQQSLRGINTLIIRSLGLEGQEPHITYESFGITLVLTDSGCSRHLLGLDSAKKIGSYSALIQRKAKYFKTPFTVFVVKSPIGTHLGCHYVLSQLEP